MCGLENTGKTLIFMSRAFSLLCFGELFMQMSLRVSHSLHLPYIKWKP